MEARVVGFIPPIVGVEEEFNTLRLGLFYSKCLSPGDTVYLLNEKERMVFGRALVTAVDVGQLADMCAAHGHKNHTELGNDPATAAAGLFRTIQKIYGPHIATEKKKCVVISLRRLKE